MNRFWSHGWYWCPSGVLRLCLFFPSTRSRCLWGLDYLNGSNPNWSLLELSVCPRTVWIASSSSISRGFLLDRCAWTGHPGCHVWETRLLRWFRAYRQNWSIHLRLIGRPQSRPRPKPSATRFPGYESVWHRIGHYEEFSYHRVFLSNEEGWGNVRDSKF